MFRTVVTSATGLVTITINDRPAEVCSGISVAAAILGTSDAIRTTVVSGSPRGPYCMMGACFDCLVTIDGQANQQGCMVQVREGMKVDTQDGAVGISGESELPFTGDSRD